MKKFALLLTFLMFISIFPAKVSAGMPTLSGGAAPTILRMANTTVSRTQNSHHLRFLSFTAADFGIHNRATSAHAVVTLSGSERRWVRDADTANVSNADWTFIQNNMLPAGAGNVRNDILFFSKVGNPPADISVLLYCSRGISNNLSNSNRAVVVVYVGENARGANLGISMPVQFYTGNNDDAVTLQISGSRGFSPARQDVTAAATRSGTADDDENDENGQNGDQDDGYYYNGPGSQQPQQPPQPPTEHLTVIRLVIGEMSHTVNGVPAITELAPFIDPVYERTMVPLRMVMETLGAEVNWIYETRTATIYSQGEFLTLQVDSALPYGMGMPVIVNDRTFVPIRYVAETLGAEVFWDEVNRAVYIRQ